MKRKEFDEKVTNLKNIYENAKTQHNNTGEVLNALSEAIKLLERFRFPVFI